MDRVRRLIITLTVAVIVLASVAAFATPLSAGAGNASKTAAVTFPKAAANNASTAAVKTTPVVRAGTWFFQTVASGNILQTSLALTPTGWPAISYRDATNGDLKYTYKDATGWHNQLVDSAGDVGWHASLQLTPTGWPAISYYDVTNSDLKYTYKDASGWHIQTVDTGGAYTSLQLTPTGWPAISYDGTTGLKYTYKSAS